MNSSKHATDTDAGASCPICASRGGWLMPFRDIDSGTIAYHGSSNYHWRVCRKCATGFPSASFGLEQMQAYWNKNRVESVNDEDIESVYQARLADAMYWADTTYQFHASNTTLAKKGAFLDIACGLGATVKKFQDMGWRAEGLDADVNTKHSHERLGVNTRIGQFEYAGIEHQYDLISIAHAIYFITDPRQFFRTVHDSLSDEGEFCVVTSNFTSMLSSGLPSQVHTWYPTAAAIEFAASVEGLGLVGVRKTAGSTFMLFRKRDRVAGCPRNTASAIMLATQHARHLFIGRYVLSLGRFLKSIARRMKRNDSRRSA
jgi:2-polyprenyl-3-methyl-5-hydroxy-6-metoxy-1,4-benzoquinol methylase